MAAVDVSSATLEIVGQLAAIGAVGGAVLGLVVLTKGVEWVKVVIFEADGFPSDRGDTDYYVFRNEGESYESWSAREDARIQEALSECDREESFGPNDGMWSGSGESDSDRRDREDRDGGPSMFS